jgi:hypothetical protein
VEDKEQYWVKIANRFSALEILDADVDIKRTWETIRISKFQSDSMLL